VRRYAAVVFILVSLIVPFASAVVPDNIRQAGPTVTGPDLTMTGTDITNHSIPSRYAISPAPIEVKVRISETSLPGPKGEMQAGPRVIGFAADPVSLAIIIIAVIALATGIWYVARRKPGESDDGEEERK
jgi:hypothetical protein